MRLTRIHTGGDGRSHFDDVELPDREVRAGVVETNWFDATRASLRFLTPSAGFGEQPRHVAPRRQVAVIVSGALEVECAEGVTRRFDAGAVVLLEDLRGEGHVTWLVQSPCMLVDIALSDSDFLTPSVQP
jgi:hypothetical protein